MAENEQLKKTGRFRVRLKQLKKYARKKRSESSSFMTYNAPARGSVASNNNMNMYNIINNIINTDSFRCSRSTFVCICVKENAPGHESRRRSERRRFRRLRPREASKKKLSRRCLQWLTCLFASFAHQFFSTILKTSIGISKTTVRPGLFSRERKAFLRLWPTQIWRRLK